MSFIPNLVSANTVRRDTKAFFQQVQSSNQPFFVLVRQDPQAVVINLELFKKLMEVYEDYLDSVELNEAYQKEKGKKGKSTKELRKELGL